MTRYYVGTGTIVGAWGDYSPSLEDRAIARRIAEATAERVTLARRRRTGYGDAYEAKASWYESGFLGEVAALLPFGAGPNLDHWEGRSGWQGSTDYYGRVEVRTTSTWQLYGFARWPAKSGAVGLAGWRVTAKDAGRLIICVEERQDAGTFRVHGWARADDIPRLPVPLGPIVAVVDYGDLRRDVLELVG